MLRLRSLVFVLIGGLLGGSAFAQTPVARQLRNTGPSATRVNVAILGDGYTAAQQEQFFADAQRKLDVLLNNESFAAFRDYTNGVAVFTASNESGTDIAADGVTRDTYYDTGFSGTVNARLLTVATAAGRSRATAILREYLPEYDIAVVLVNTPLYGGAGGALTVTSLHTSSDEVLLHENGHSFAKLTDEYVDDISAPSYPPGEFINATQKSARADIPWRDFILDTTPVPTTAVSTDGNFVGLWEGAHYRATGFYRPTYNSKMRSLGQPFGPVNLRAFAASLHRLNLNGATTPPRNPVLASPAAHASPGGTLSLAVTAEGAGPFSYQWSFNGKYLGGQTNATLALGGVSAAQIGAYAVEVTNAQGTLSSSTAGITAGVVNQSGAFDVQIGTQPTVRWSQPMVYVSEGNPSVALTIVRGGGGGALSVNYATVAGTATAPADFTAQAGTVTWAAGDMADKTISIPIVADALAEGIETFTVALAAPSAGIIADSPSVTVAIADAGTRDPTFNASFISNSVMRVVPLADGSMLVAGFFSSLQDAFTTTYNFGRIARLRRDGTIDPTFKPGAGADGTVYALARQPDGKILIGGDFANYDGTPRGRIARLTADGVLDPTFNPGAGANGRVYEVVVQPDGKILLGGGFTTFNGTPREYLARLNADGSLDASFTGPDFGATTGWWVRSIALLPDGGMYAAGVFFFSGTAQRGSICRLTATGALDPAFNGIVQGASAAFTGSSLGELVQVAVQPDNKVLICGTLITYNQTSRRGLARLTATGALDTSFNPGTGGDQPVDTLLVQADGKIVIGGRFTTFNGAPANHLARLNANGSVDPAFLPAGGPAGAVLALARQADGNLLVAGAVGTLQGSTSSRPVWRLFASTTAAAASGGDTPVIVETPPLREAGRLVNLSIRTELASATDNFTVGFNVGGAGTSGTKALLVRAAGPSLAVFGLTGVLADPKLEFYTGTTKVGENDNWAGSATVSAMMTQVAAFPFASETSLDAALALPALASGSHSAIISGTGAGTVIAELYDTTSTAFLTTTPRLVNVSVLKQLGSGVIMGFVVAGSSPCKVLIRAVGPTLGLEPFNLPGVAADPQLALFSGQTQLLANDNWGGDATLSAAFASVAAFALPASSRDAALVTTLQPGPYTVQVSGVNNTTGVALVEVYEVP